MARRSVPFFARTGRVRRRALLALRLELAIGDHLANRELEILRARAQLFVDLFDAKPQGSDLTNCVELAALACPRSASRCASRPCALEAPTLAADAAARRLPAPLDRPNQTGPNAASSWSRAARLGDLGNFRHETTPPPDSSRSACSCSFFVIQVTSARYRVSISHRAFEHTTPVRFPMNTTDLDDQFEEQACGIVARASCR